jgi:hypothetical protein
VYIGGRNRSWQRGYIVDAGDVVDPSYQSRSGGITFGFSGVKGRSYLFFNADEGTGILHTGQYTPETAESMPHQEFAKLYGEFDDSIREGRR